MQQLNNISIGGAMNCTLRFFLLLFSPFTLNATTLKIASYNVENLFDMQHNGIEYQAYIPNKHNWTAKNFQKKLLNIAEVICDINADIIALQEIENENVLKILKQRLRSIGCHYRYHAISHKKYSAIQLAMLSKIPIKNVKEIKVNRGLKYRPILETKFIVANKALYIFNNHWSSKRSKESTRMLSARALKKRLFKLPPNSEYILLGDFNVNYNEYQDFEKKFNDTHGTVGLNHILQTVQKRKLIREKNMYSIGFKHYNLWLEVPNYKRWSYNFYGKKQGLDAILLPPSLFDAKGLDYVNNSFKVFKTSYLFTKKGYINRWQYKKRRHLGRGYSDHLPIVATFSTLAYEHDYDREKIIKGSIKDLYVQKLKHSVFVQDLKVISKERKLAKLREVHSKREIYLYGAKALKEGEVYDLLVHEVKNYKGLQEIIDFTVQSQSPKKLP